MGLISRVSSRTYREMYPNQGGAGYPQNPYPTGNMQNSPYPPSAGSMPYPPPHQQQQQPGSFYPNQGQYPPQPQQNYPGYQQPHQPSTSKSNDILNQAMAMGGAMLAGKAMGGKKGKTGSSGMSGMTGMAMNMLSGSSNKNSYG